MFNGLIYERVSSACNIESVQLFLLFRILGWRNDTFKPLSFEILRKNESVATGEIKEVLQLRPSCYRNH